jgi:adenylate cyclase
MQRGMLERIANDPIERQIRFRVGINVGDIIIDGADIFGDGVNIASRLQTLAEPGGICVSRAVRDQVVDKLTFPFEDLGAREVKNITRPVEVFRVDLRGGAKAHKRVVTGSRWWRHPWSTQPWNWLAVGAAVFAVAGVAVSALHQERGSPPTLAAMSVAVLPFAAIENNLIDVQMADSLRSELIDRIAMYDSRMRVLRIDARDANRNPGDVGRRYRVRYVVEGVLQREDAHRLLQLRVVEAESGAQLLGQRHVLPDVPAEGPPPSAGTRTFLLSVPQTVYEAEIRRAAK